LNQILTPIRAGVLLALAWLSAMASASALTAAVSASPTTGLAPLTVFFDGGQSSADSSTFFWNFGDGAVSTAKAPIHTYTVAGTYVAQLTVNSAAGASSASSVTIVVTGSGQGAVTSNMNFRWAPTDGRLLYTGRGRDRFTMNAFFNTVDLPPRLLGVAASLSINNSFTVNGIMNENGTFINPNNSRLKFEISLIIRNQILQVFIAGADLSTALTGKVGGTLPNGRYPINISLTVGAQSFSVTETFQFTNGLGVYNLRQQLGLISDGFFVVSNAAALENVTGDGHFYVFTIFLTAPQAKLILRPTQGVWIFTFNQAKQVIIPFDRFTGGKGGLILYKQSDRDLGGIQTLNYDPVHRVMSIKTWDLPANPLLSGTGLPLRGDPFTAFNFTIRIDLDQPDGSTFRGVTATRLSRRARDDAFWQTGRRNKVQ
jgi:PKD repeat protein